MSGAPLSHSCDQCGRAFASRYAAKPVNHACTKRKAPSWEYVGYLLGVTCLDTNEPMMAAPPPRPKDADLEALRAKWGR